MTSQLQLPQRPHTHIVCYNGCIGLCKVSPSYKNQVNNMCVYYGFIHICIYIYKYKYIDIYIYLFIYLFVYVSVYDYYINRYTYTRNTYVYIQIP